jgi:hypothetical protein
VLLSLPYKGRETVNEDSFVGLPHIVLQRKDAEKIARQFNQWRKDNGNLPNSEENVIRFVRQALDEYWESETVAADISRITL